MRENEYLINTIQEITLQAYAFGIYDYFFNERDMSRTDIFKVFVEWANEFEETHENFDWMQGSFYDEVDEFLNYRFDSIKIEDKIRDAFPGGITKGDHISYEGGILKVTGFSNCGVIVEEIKPCPENPDWIVTEIGYSQSNKVKIIPGYEDIMDTTNGHNPELVAKINIAWNEKREQFFPIMCALYKRDNDEILASDAFADWEKVSKDYDTLYEYMRANWDIEAYNYLQHIADDTDLECILNYLHAQ
jgi:hypothetical protein